MNELSTICHRKIKLPVEFIPVDFGMGPNDPHMESKFKEGQVNKEFRDWLSSMGIRTQGGRYFHNPPFNKYNLHVDINLISLDDPEPTPSIPYLNLVYGGQGSHMKWYEILPGKVRDTYINKVGCIVPKYNENECKEIYMAECIQAEDGFANLINGGIIHTMINGPNPRRCYSVILCKGLKRLNWEEIYPILEPYFID